MKKIKKIKKKNKYDNFVGVMNDSNGKPILIGCVSDRFRKNTKKLERCPTVNINEEKWH